MKKKCKGSRELINFFCSPKKILPIKILALLLGFNVFQVLGGNLYSDDAVRTLIVSDTEIETFTDSNVAGKPTIIEVQQEIVIKGTVTDADGGGSPLHGVNVVVKGTFKGTSTDLRGEYTITVKDPNATLVFTYVGFRTEEIKISGQTTINVVMTEEAFGLDEVVVSVGYGTTKKSDLTGSVSQIGDEELKVTQVFDFTQAMKSRASGVQVSKNSGDPGGNIEVRIRGGNSMVASNAPLYVVDGFPVIGNPRDLNPADIKSMDILKDASATAIYGSRGANGVIIITTKRGKLGQRGSVDLNSSYGVQTAAKLYDVLDAKQYATVANEWLKNEGLPPFFDVESVVNPGTDWQDLIFRTAPVQNHTLTISDGGENTNYSLSVNYFAQDGIVINSGVRRGSLRLNLDHKINNFITLGVNSSISRREINLVPVDNQSYGGGLYDGALTLPPTLPVYDENGNLYRIESVYPFSNLDMRHVLIYDKPYKNRGVYSGTLLNTFLDFKIIKGLTFKTLFGLQYQHGITDGFSPIIFEGDFGSARNGYTYFNSFLNENTLNYLKEFDGGSTLNIVTGFTNQSYVSRSQSISVSKLSTNVVENYNLGSAEIINPPSDDITEWTLLSYLARLNYTHKNKYLFTATLRTDGSSRFGADNKWGTFPSFAFAWRISEESFFGNITFINDAKMRASYGITGNTALSPYQSLDRLSSVRMVQGGSSESVGYFPSAVGNAELKWETTAQLNIGFDMSFLKSRINLTFDYYDKKTKNLLATVPLPPSVGFSSSLFNAGTIQNRGVELSFDALVMDRSFRWEIMGQISANRNKVLEIAGNSDLFGPSDGHPFNSTLTIARVGEPLGMFYGLLEDGLDDEGYIKYVDLDTNGVINALDRTIIGNPFPKFIFGLSNTFSFWNFDLSVFIEGVYGNDIFWSTAGVQLDSFHRGNNQFTDLMGNYWTAENPNPNAKYPIISSRTVADVSDRYVKDGSYLRFQEIKLAYNLPVQNITWCQHAQIYLLGTNLLTITSYPGLDPDVNTHGDDSALLNGIDKTAYPSARVISGGINISF